jgi:hypothetical protein
VIVADGYDAVANTMEVLALPGPAGSVRNTLEGSEGMSAEDASLLTIGQYPTTVSVNDLQRVISLMFASSAIPTQPSVRAMIFR